ncbi:MAG TPA: hypothetical protein VE398_26160 [Acidobacteriota bacterium]|nr:hypothetical protein [Acidobacteriota bacterium]
MKASSLREAIVQIFEDEPNKRFALKEVYERIKDHYELSESDKELDAKYPQPRFYHEARGIIATLEREGFIERLDRDRRRLRPRATKS